ncbi:hypothetical protein HY440_03040 [Candidatus Microgenomates bacterium]|nr:hypothetical protein [Candidatus Microgenomates bacterium]
MKTLLVKIGMTAAAGLLLASIVAPTFAIGPDAMPDKAGSRPGLLRNFLDKRGRAAIGSGTLKSKSGNTVPATLVVTREGVDYTINVDANTQLRRRFWGKATLAEMSVGDTLNVIGQWADDGHTAINAKLVRDASIQKKFGVFFGTILSLLSNGWTMTTGRGTETVVVSSSTKLVNRKGEAITQADVKVNDKVRVRGLWDNKLNTITEVSGVKDYSLPTK